MTAPEQPPIVELGVYVQRHGAMYYPVGSDTPIPLSAIVENGIPPFIADRFEPSEFEQEVLRFDV